MDFGEYLGGLGFPLLLAIGAVFLWRFGRSEAEGSNPFAWVILVIAAVMGLGGLAFAAFFAFVAMMFSSSGK